MSKNKKVRVKNCLNLAKYWYKKIRFFKNKRISFENEQIAHIFVLHEQAVFYSPISIIREIDIDHTLKTKNIVTKRWWIKEELKFGRLIKLKDKLVRKYCINLGTIELIEILNVVFLYFEIVKFMTHCVFFVTKFMNQKD